MTLDRLIYDLDMAYYKLTDNVPDGIDPDSWAWYVHQAVAAITWYVGTGRASMETVNAIRQCRPGSLLKYMARSDDHSDDGLIKAMHTYLKRRKHGA